MARTRAPPWITVLFFPFKYLHQLKLRSLLNLYPNGGVICFSELPPKPSDKDDAKTVISGVGGWISILSNGILDISVCCEVILRVRGLALDISIEGAVRMCANVLTVPAILVSNSNQMQWCERGWGGGGLVSRLGVYHNTQISTIPSNYALPLK